jgi:Na+-translocating ferredoxin:NAD+ oxidoreductase subunit D
MRFPEYSAPHLAPATSVGLVMRRVVYAVVPGAAVMALLFGWGVLLNMLLAVTTALICEALMLRLRGRPTGPYLRDCSAVLAALLLALALPPLLPWWITVLGVAFGLIFGKHLYGGLGFNPFNPAMVGYVVLLISFPREMTLWPAPAFIGGTGPDLWQTLVYVFSGHFPDQLQFDAISRATPLDEVRVRLGQDESLQAIRGGPAFGTLGAHGWEWINLLFLAGGLWLLRCRVIGWQIPVGVLAGIAVPALLFSLIGPDQYPGAAFHLLAGGAMLGAFFIATDPVSAATTRRGRLYYGLGIGILTWVIRTWGGYPDGIAFAVLLMNMAAPLIDQYTRPRIHGRGSA